LIFTEVSDAVRQGIALRTASDVTFTESSSVYLKPLQHQTKPQRATNSLIVHPPFAHHNQTPQADPRALMSLPAPANPSQRTNK
jgi:hypothetical protein